MEDNGKEFIADLHIHSRFARATSKNIDIPNLVKYAKIKGLSLLGTGDFQHPGWIKELRDLEEREGILYYQDFPFLWQTEISLMYSQDGKGRRIHHVILAPSADVVGQITGFLGSRGRLDYDGRPIFGFSSVELVEEMERISKDIEIIPAHCLLPESQIHVKTGVGKIEGVKVGDCVLTHFGRFKRVKEVHKRYYSGEIINIVPSCLKIGSWFTPEHPIYVIKSYKSCKKVPHTICKPTCAYLKRGCKVKAYEGYKPGWKQIKDLEKGDVILYPRYNKVKDISFLDLSKILQGIYVDGNYVKSRKEKIFLKNLPVNKKIEVSEDFCRLIGYYLSEGYVSRGHIGFTFNKKEVNYLKDLQKLLIDVFGPFLNIKFIEENSGGISLIIHSKILADFFKMFYESDSFMAYTKKLPPWFLDLPVNKLKQLLIGWWRGDGGITTSRNLMNQFKTILIKIGIIPSINLVSAKKIRELRKKRPNKIGNRIISVNKDYYSFGMLCFFNHCKELLNLPEFKKFRTKLNRRKGWIDNNYIYLPVIRIDYKSYEGDVYNLEVEADNSYLTENLAVHNCWTPWFGVFGSMSGFDSLKDCFKDKVNKIHAIETGLSSDPEMNWRIKELNDKSIVSFSDAHSFWPHRIGREATIFTGELTYHNILGQIRENSFKATVEVDPAYGKYHFDGHRNCGFFCSPEESKKLGNICPKCGKQLTIGVENRVEQLSDNPLNFRPGKAKPFYKLLPLQELIALAKSSTLTSKKTWLVYNQLIEKFGNELNILLNVDKKELARFVDENLVGLIIDNRIGNINVQPGFDGEYGRALLREKQGKLF